MKAFRVVAAYFVIFLVSILFIFPTNVYAADSCDINLSTTEVVIGEPLTVFVENAINDDELINSHLAPGGSGRFYFEFTPSENKSPDLLIVNGEVLNNGESGYIFYNEISGSAGYPSQPGEYKVSLRHWLNLFLNNGEIICESQTFTVVEESTTPEPSDLCTTGSPSEIPESGVFIPSDIDRENEFTGLIRAGENFANQTLYLRIIDNSFGLSPLDAITAVSLQMDELGTASFAVSFDDYPSLEDGEYEVWITSTSEGIQNQCIPPRDLEIYGERECLEIGENCDPTDTTTEFCGETYYCDPDSGKVDVEKLSTFQYICTSSKQSPTCIRCEIFSDDTQNCVQHNDLADCTAACESVNSDLECISEKGENGVSTAFGCFVYSDLTSGVASLIKFAVYLGGGVALILIAYSAFLIMTSAGDPKKLANAKSLLASTLVALFMFASSTLILRVLGISFLGLF